MSVLFRSWIPSWLPETWARGLRRRCVRHFINFRVLSFRIQIGSVTSLFCSVSSIILRYSTAVCFLKSIVATNLKSLMSAPLSQQSLVFSSFSNELLDRVTHLAFLPLLTKYLRNLDSWWKYPTNQKQGKKGILREANGVQYLEEHQKLSWKTVPDCLLHFLFDLF